MPINRNIPELVQLREEVKQLREQIVGLKGLDIQNESIITQLRANLQAELASALRAVTSLAAERNEARTELAKARELLTKAFHALNMTPRLPINPAFHIELHKHNIALTDDIRAAIDAARKETTK